ncbi:HNH endonuclease [[Kitasatospora] papulosa]|uniref:HNH endonuclease n=1 Tax=[Kitasatospora] papulosa TaxID=1464011 RepID=UPI0036BBAAEA
MTQLTRACLQCGADISQTHGNTRRCDPCSAEHQKRQASRNPDESAKCFDRNEADGCTRGKLRRLRCSKHYKRAIKAQVDLAPPPRTCLGCGEGFTPWRHDTLHCSRRCTTQSSYNRNRRPDKTRPCIECGKAFPVTRTDRITCSRTCGQRRSARRRYKGIRDFVCAHCLGTFQAIRSDALYCSRWCRRRAYYTANRERLIADAARWAVDHPEEMQARRRARRAHKRNNAGSVGVEVDDWRRLVARYLGCCAYCGGRPETIQMDHVVPLARGGRHAIGNVLPACPTCNNSKSATLLAVWRHQRKLPLAS